MTLIRLILIKSLCLGLHELLDEMATKLIDTEVHLELGRFLVANAGMYLCKIVDIKESRGKTFWVCDGGMHHHLANSGNLGQVFRKNYPVFLANCLDSTLTQHVDIVGPLCTPLDIIAFNISLRNRRLRCSYVIRDLWRVSQSSRVLKPGGSFGNAYLKCI